MPWVWIEVWHTPELWCGEKWCPWLTSPSFPPVVWTDLPGLCRFWPTTSESHGFNFKANTWEQNLHSASSSNYYSKMKWQGGMAIKFSVQSHEHATFTWNNIYRLPDEAAYISRSKWNLKDLILLILFWSSLVPMQNKKVKNFCIHWAPLFQL